MLSNNTDNRKLDDSPPVSPVFQMLTAVLASTGANMVRLPNQVYTGRMICKALEVLAKDVRQLGSTNLVRLLERLLLAEAQSTGIALSGISIPRKLPSGTVAKMPG